MATQNSNITAQFQEFVAKRAGRGRYANADDVLQSAMDALLREESDDEAKLAYLKEAIDEGDASGLYEGDAFADIRQKHGMRPRM